MRGAMFDQGFAEYVATSLRVNDLFRAHYASRRRMRWWIATLFAVGLLVPCLVPALMASEGEHAGR